MAILPLRGTRSPTYFGAERRRWADSNDDDDRHYPTYIHIQCSSHLQFRAREHGAGFTRRFDGASVTQLRHRRRRHPSASGDVGRPDLADARELPVARTRTTYDDVLVEGG